MRRPLFAAALFLVLIAAVRLKFGWADNVRPGFVGTGELTPWDTLLVTGQVYQKEDTSLYLKSIVIWESNAFGLSSAHSGREIHCQENFILETQEMPNIPLGSTIAVRGVFVPCSKATNPGEFDSAVYYRTLGIGGRLRKAEILAVSGEYWRVREGLYRIKQYFKERLYNIFPEKEAAVMSALLLGDKKDLDGELKDLYKRNGILHILSISSLHITIIGMSVYRLLRRTGLPVWASAAAGSVLLLLYGCMTGFSVSACRAIGMYLIKMLAEVTGRTYDMLTALGVMGAVMVIGNPYYLRNSGFLLSFTSVLGIGAVDPALAPDTGRKARKTKSVAEKGIWGTAYSNLENAAGNLSKSLRQSAFASLSITLTTLPVQLWFYYEIPIYSVFLNLFVIPFVKPLMIAGLIAMVIPGLGILGLVDKSILSMYEFLCGCFDRLPFHTWNPGCPEVWQIVVYYLLLTAVVMLRTRLKEGKEKTDPAGTFKTVCAGTKAEKGKGERDGLKTDVRGKATEKNNSPERGKATIVIKYAGGLASAGILSMAVLLFAWHPSSGNRVVFLDVGQGDCILVHTGSGENYLFDCGSSSRSNVGRYVLLPYLKYSGIRDIDAIFLSHPDADHVNGALELMDMGMENNITIRQLVLPAIEEGLREEQLGTLTQAAAGADGGKGIPVGYLAVGDSWSCKSVDFFCLHPNRGFSSQDVNAGSECVLVEFKNASSVGWTLLLTGDVEEKGEEAFLKALQAEDIGNITVLKAAHHGSRNSTPAELLDRLNPLLTVISCGRNNRYGHPHTELLERLEASGTDILRTDRVGAITVTDRGGELRVWWFSEE